MQNNRPKTILCDIDGVIFEHSGDISKQNLSTPKILSGVLDVFTEWDRKGYNIILITGRRESTRKTTEKQLTDAGIFFDQLIMGVGGGVRVLINDNKPDGENAAVAVSLIRNKGMSGLENL